MEWNVYLDDLEDANRFNVLHEYLAQIAWAVERGNPRLRRADKLKLEEYRLKFVEKGSEKKKTKNEYTQDSKNFWLMVFASKVKRLPPKVRNEDGRRE